MDGRVSQSVSEFGADAKYWQWHRLLAHQKRFQSALIIQANANALVPASMVFAKEKCNLFLHSLFNFHLQIFSEAQSSTAGTVRH